MVSKVEARLENGRRLLPAIFISFLRHIIIATLLVFPPLFIATHLNFLTSRHRPATRRPPQPHRPARPSRTIHNTVTRTMATVVLHPSGRRRTANQGHSKVKGNRIAFHHVFFLLSTSAAIGSGFNINTEMITRRKLCPLISSILEKSQPCFCWRAMKQQRMLRTYLSAENPINGEANLSPPKFYQRLNCPKNILAPMVAQSDLPFRLMCEQLYNVDLSYTQMIHAYNFIKPGCETFRTNHLDVYPHSITTDVLFGNHDREDLIVTPSQIYAMKGIDHHEIEAARSRILSVIAKSKGIHDVSELKINTKPTVVQIAAHDPDVAVEAAMVILERSGSMNSYNNGDTCTVAGIDLNLGEFVGFHPQLGMGKNHITNAQNHRMPAEHCSKRSLWIVLA